MMRIMGIIGIIWVDLVDLVDLVDRVLNLRGKYSYPLCVKINALAVGAFYLRGKYSGKGII